jgi:hypothetical protein
MVFTEAGVYEIKAAGFTCAAVIYDPSAGYVTGGGWFISPKGAFKNDVNKQVKATFGFNAKYEKGAKIPQGDTSFIFQAGSFSFKSTSYDWLVVEGGKKAKYKGFGTSYFDRLSASSRFSFYCTNCESIRCNRG